ncbi:hypothetical protein R5W24_003509 [Gemmata sp. JC717]|uniref:Uncharacterized protein n=1 Tax=Gemmata algarum TaxID=2975278 RepID=A0ABU5ETJ3_9BACT|nr:hypothetical protein [Gemmata algarum]MDY3554387.1 hypothetical protein [Gemmata algarum]MDY3558520.1 hypothetical protein [Gemmata algarum]
MAEGLPLFSTAALAVLDRMPFDPAARGSYDLMSGGLWWPDEFPGPGTADGKLVRLAGAYRCLLAYRRALTLGEERDGFRPVWEQVVRHAPNWPGLRPERRGNRAAQRLRAALRRADTCLADFESRLGAGEPGAAQDTAG